MAIPAHITSPINTRLSSQAARARTGLFCFVMGLGEAAVAGVNRTLDPNRPAPGNWLKKSPVRPPSTPPTHALNRVWPPVWKSCPQIIQSVEMRKCARREARLSSESFEAKILLSIQVFSESEMWNLTDSYLRNRIILIAFLQISKPEISAVLFFFYFASCIST